MDERFQESQTSVICLICRQPEVVPGLTSVYFEREELRLWVNNVPALVCPGCEEAYVDEDVATWLLQAAEAVSETGVLEASVTYSIQQTS